MSVHVKRVGMAMCTTVYSKCCQLCVPYTAEVRLDCLDVIAHMYIQGHN